MPLPQITLEGNLVDDPELRYTPGGHPVAKFRIACGERVQDRETKEWKDGDTCFLTVEAWFQQAENIAESLRRGMAIMVTGRLRQRSYETKEGEKRSVYEVKDAKVAAALSNATAKVEKNARTGTGTVAGTSQPAAGGYGGASAPAGTSAASPVPPAGNTGGRTQVEEPPF